MCTSTPVTVRGSIMCRCMGRSCKRAAEESCTNTIRRVFEFFMCFGLVAVFLYFFTVEKWYEYLYKIVGR